MREAQCPVQAYCRWHVMRLVATVILAMHTASQVPLRCTNISQRSAWPAAPETAFNSIQVLPPFLVELIHS